MLYVGERWNFLWLAQKHIKNTACEKEGNHLSLLFRAIYATGNRGNIWKLPKYGVASHTQCFAERNEGAFTWGNLTLCRMKPLSERPVESQKPWTESGD